MSPGDLPSHPPTHRRSTNRAVRRTERYFGRFLRNTAIAVGFVGLLPVLGSDALALAIAFASDKVAPGIGFGVPPRAEPLV